MSIGSVGAATGFATTITNPFQQRRQDFQALQQALAQGDLGGAQSAFSALQQLLQNAGGGAAGTGGTTATAASAAASSTSSPLAADWTTLSQALTAGDLQGAQTAFAQLKTDFRASTPLAGAGGAFSAQIASATSGARAHHGGHHHHGAASTASTTTSQSTSTGAATDPDGDADGSSSSSTGSLLNVTT